MESVSYSIPALRLVQSTKKIRRLANVIFVGLLVSIMGIAILPWQQTAKGTGRVMAFVPQERQQTVAAPVKGIVASVSPGLREGDQVVEGQVILELLPAAGNLAEQTDKQINDLDDKLKSIDTKIQVYRQNVKDFEDARDSAVKAAGEMVDSAIAKQKSKEQLLPGYQAKLLQAKLNLDRQKQLLTKGATPEKEVEKLERDWEIAKSELESIKLDIQSAEFEVKAKRNELNQKRSEAQTKVDSSKAYEAAEEGARATVQKEKRDLEIKRKELDQLTIRSPRNGTIFRLPVYERGQIVKEGEELFTIVPDTKDLAVEMWVNGLDTPLILIGDHVRLQFEGWPAIQFAGWPSVAVGTFGGEVVAIDDSDDGSGKFRIQVRPTAEDPWPATDVLRQGVRTNGWVMLRQVKLGYEIWRQINGFPPTRSDDSAAMEKPKVPKLPK